MANLGARLSAQPLKLLLIGDSGSGKTGALASLANAGFELFLLDFDNGTDVLSSVVKPEFYSKIHIETLTDTGKLAGAGTSQKIVKMNPQAFTTALSLLTRWVDRETKEDFGPVSSWDTKRVLVIDSLSFMGMAALDYILAKNGRGGEQPFQSDWGDAMRLLEQTLQILYSTEIKCHVVMNSHIDYQQPEGGGLMRGLPMGLGSKLSPKIGRYFNMMLLAKSRGGGAAAKRVILTKPEGLIEVKCPILSAAPEYPIDTGLAELFKLWGQVQSATKAAPSNTPAKS